MKTESVARRVFAVIPAVAVCILGMPGPAGAAGEDGVVVAGNDRLTLNGRPLSQLLNTTVSTGGGILLPVRFEQGTGQIIGVALTNGQTRAPNRTVQLTSIPDQDNRDVIGNVVTTATDGDGRFSFPGLRPGYYFVEVLDGGHVAASEFVAVADGDVVFIEVGRPAQPSTADERKGQRILLWMAVGAGVGGGLGLISNAGVDCHHEENLCDVRSIGGAVMGALAGLMIGTAR